MSSALRHQFCGSFKALPLKFGSQLQGFAKRRSAWQRRSNVILRTAASISAEPAKQNVNNNPKAKKTPDGGVSKAMGIEELKKVRKEKIQKLKEIGMEPFAYNFSRTHSSNELQSKYSALPPGAVDDTVHVAVAGRVVAKRSFGKLAFLDLLDDSGTIQAYLDKGHLGNESFKRLVELSDVGDIIGVEGSIKRTEKGELSVYTTNWAMLTKSVQPMPDKFHGLQDVHMRYRYRHLDMITNPRTLQVFKTRSLIISAIRRWLDERSFLEVETPILTDQPGGADAKPFVTFHNSLQMPLTLRIATELHLKRLVVGGLPRVYEIGRIFRNEGLSSRHNPEFTSIELYQSYADYHDMMNLTESLIVDITRQLTGGSTVVQCNIINSYGEEESVAVDLTPPWRRVSMSELVHEKLGIDFEPFLAADDLGACLEAVARAESVSSKLKSEVRELGCVGDVLNTLFESLEEALVQPTFVTHQPISVSPLARRHRTLPGVTERFELFVVGRELANAFTELTDPLEQRLRFEEQLKAKHKEDVQPVDEDFLHALEIGMPPTGGLGIGIDRLVMLLTNSPTIKDVIAFPLQKREASNPNAPSTGGDASNA